MKLLIVTASQDTKNWKTISKKLADIQKTLDTVKNGRLEVSLTERELKPEVVNGRITHKWFDWFSFPFYENGYDFVILHFSGAQKKEWGINPKLGGSSHTNDGDLVGEAWFWADEKSTRKGQIRFVETCLHEISHLIAKGTGVPDMTHTEDAKKGTVEKLFKTYDMSLYLKKEKELEAKKTFLQQQIDKLKALLAEQKPKGLQPLVERKAQAVVKGMELLGIPVRITEGYRSIERQNELYAQGRTTKGAIITQAKGGESFHNYGIAVDVIFIKTGYNAPESHWQSLGTVARREGFEWGGDWKGFVDKPHIEMKLGYTLADFKNGKVDYKKYQ